MSSHVDRATLNDLLRSSRQLLPSALSALSEISAEVSGHIPPQVTFARLSRFFLMHFCDQFVYEEFRRNDEQSPQVNSVFCIPIWTSTEKSNSILRQRAIESVLTSGIDNPSLVAESDEPRVRYSVRRQLLSTIGARSAQVAVTEPYLKCSRRQEVAAALQMRRIARWRNTREFTVPTSDIDFSRRLAIVTRDAHRDDRHTLVKRALALTAPIELVEGFNQLRAQCMHHQQVHSGLIYTANAYQSSSSFRFWVEHCRERGARLATHQHGGGYGIDLDHLGEDFDVSVSDIFYSWGWNTTDGGTRVRPLPPAWPDRYTGQPTSEYLLMSLPITTHMYRLQSFLMPSQVSETISQTLALIRGLVAPARLRIRTHQGDTLPLSQVSTTSGVSLLLDDLQASGTIAASRAKLVLHNYLSTAWLETMALNIPTVCFYDPEIYSPRDSARPYIDALARVGVIHYSGVEAAKFVNGLNGEPSAWWLSSEVQEAREAFVARYANFSENWLPAWMEEFERLLAE